MKLTAWRSACDRWAKSTELICGSHLLLLKIVVTYPVKIALNVDKRSGEVSYLSQVQMKNREIKTHVYAKRQTPDSSWDFLRIENISR